MGLISKFIPSKPGKQKITIHTLPDISSSKGNQTMKLGQLRWLVRLKLIQLEQQKTQKN